MPSRQFHTKSRLGCANCKRRKIRCGEERPQCENCSRLGGKCSFLKSDPQGGIIAQGYETSSASEESMPPKPLVASDLSRLAEDLEQFDDELIKQYFSTTSLTITDRADVASAWQVTVVDLARTHSFLRHGLMSLAAMHLRYGCSPELQPLYSELASLHQDKALEKYIPVIPQLEAITRENCDALFAFSLMLQPLRYSFLVTSNEPFDARGFITQIINNFEYLLGATVISAKADAWIQEGILSKIVTVRHLESIIPHLLEEPQSALITLMNYISQLSTVDEDHAQQSPSYTDIATRVSIYKHSIGMLSNAFPSTDSNRRYIDATIGWPFFVGADLIRLLKESDSMALVILGFYGVALHFFRVFWWLDGVGARLVEAVSQVISPAHMSLLQWPLAKISSN